MAKPLKIEALNLQSVVAAGINAGKNPQQIADDCTRKAKKPISNMAVRRYLEATNGTITDTPSSFFVPTKKKEVAVKSSPDRVQRLVDRDIDLIELQYSTTKALADRFQWISELPDTFDNRMKQLRAAVMEEGVDTTTLDHWGLGFTLELRRNIGNMTMLNREIRQNSQFMATLREKAFEFNLVTEYLEGFLEEFRKVNEQAFEEVSERMATNPRLQRIIEQIQQLGGGDRE